MLDWLQWRVKNALRNEHNFYFAEDTITKIEHVVASRTIRHHGSNTINAL